MLAIANKILLRPVEASSEGHPKRLLADAVASTLCPHTQRSGPPKHVRLLLTRMSEGRLRFR
jgi:hypothetical protein